MGKHIQLYKPTLQLNEVVHGDLNDLNIKIYLPKKDFELESFETQVNKLLKRTTQFHKTKVYKNLIMSTLQLDASLYKFTTDYVTAFIKDFKTICESLKLKIDNYKIEEKEFIIFLK